LTAGTLVPSRFAVSRAEKPAASRRISVARCRGGRCWIAATNAISSVSRATGCLVRVHQPIRIRLEPRHVGSDPRKIALGTGRGRDVDGQHSRAAARPWSRHAFVAMRYSQAPNDHHPSRLNRARARQAHTKVSCTRSSESSNDPTMR
jgi:hypothetical protein